MRNTLLLLLLLLLVLPAQAQDEEGIAEWECPSNFSGQTLSVFNWSTYIADNTIDDFEDACDVDVTYALFENDDEVYNVVSQGNTARYDIVIPSGAVISQMIAENLLLPLDLEQIPNMANISEELLNAPFDEGNQYSLPYQWGTIAIGYNTNAFPDGITSWLAFQNYEGSVGWLDDSRSMLATTLLLLEYDPNTTETSEIFEARNLLGELGSSSGDLRIYGDPDGQDALANGEVDLIVEYSGDIIDLTYECECDDFAYVIPDEGANLWIDNMAIPVGATNVELAHAFIDYILHPQVGADISNFTAYGSPNQTAIDMGLINEELLNNSGIYPSDEVRENLFFVRDLGANVNDVYSAAWDEILTFFGD